MRTGAYGLLTFVIVLTAFLFLVSHPIKAYAFDSGSTGGEGVFDAYSSTTTTLTSGVHNFTTVNIHRGATVKFDKDADNSSVTILASGDVTIDGKVDVSGTDATSTAIGVGGPGGYDGGMGGRSGFWDGKGLKGDGPGGGGGGNATNYGAGGGGGFGTAGVNVSAAYGAHGGDIYGDPTLISLIGGSGGGGSGIYSTNKGAHGGGGGGAILIASSGAITLGSTGKVLANGGKGGAGGYAGGGGGGSGGGIRLVANTIKGGSSISAANGTGGSGNYGGSAVGRDGGDGRIRIEANDIHELTASIDPAPSYGVAPASVSPANIPSITITSIGGTAVPSGAKGLSSVADYTLPPGTPNSVAVVVSASNVPLGTQVSVLVSPATNVSGYPVTFTSTTGLSGTLESSSTTINNVNLDTTQVNVISVYANY